MASKKAYDIFLSYARIDDEHRLITGLGEEMRAIFRRRTGHKLKIFQDRPEIQTSETWQPRIESALQESALLVPVISKAYFGSDWCRREWYYFVAAERGLASDQGLRLIYPVMLNGTPRVAKGSPIAQSWLNDVMQRQAVDLGGAAQGSYQHDAQVQLLMDGIMAKLHQLKTRHHTAVHSTGVEHLDGYSGYVGEGERFTELLAEALSVTIVGLTNQTLGDTLRNALETKRRNSGKPDDFWQSLRIVFLSDRLLDSLNDVLTDVPDQAEALLTRRLAASYGMRSIRILLEQVLSSYWELYESQYQLSFAGSLFEMPDGRRTVQLLLRRPQRRTPNQMYIEFDVRPDQYMTGAFEDIVQTSTPLRYIIPVGLPREDGVFRCTGRRFRERVLRDGSHAGGWLPVVLLVTWRHSDGQPELWLQLRTTVNSHREVGRLAHLANYVFQDDMIAAGESISESAVGFDLSPGVLVCAAQRCFRAETGENPANGVSQEGTSRYVYPDKENLYFSLFTAELPPYPHFPEQADMRPVSVSALTAVREGHALRNAVSVCKLARRSGGTADLAAEIAALNLTLHDHLDLAEQVRSAVRSPTKLEAASRRIESLGAQTRQVRHADRQLVQVVGLGGLQHREFFTTFLPLYDKLGVPGAAELLAAFRQDRVKQDAVERLRVIYNNEALMSTLSGMEL